MERVRLHARAIHLKRDYQLFLCSRRGRLGVALGGCGGGVLGDMLVSGGGGGAPPSVLRRDDTSLLASALGSAVLLSLARSTFAPSFAMTLTMASIVVVRLHGNLLLDRVRGMLAQLRR